MNISRISDPAVNNLQTPGTTKPEAKTPTGGKSFTDTLKESIGKVEDLQQSADQSINDLATGRTKTLHETMISVEQAELSFKMLMAVRGKVINAYHEIMRMQF
ncbi:MAG: flagellar hook-basal body complex protein FliE [Pseudomonadota bacterium]